MEKRFEVQLTGLSPLIMHWDNIEWADQMDAARTQIKENDKAQFSAGDDRCPPETWKGYVYNDEQSVAMPTDNLRTCLMKAGAKVTLKNKETFKKLVPAGVLFEDLFGRFLNDGRQIKIADIQKIDGGFASQASSAQKLGFKLLAKRAKVGMSKHIRVRPIFSKWSVITNILVVDDRITDDQLTRIWEIAGLRVGLGDWRPDSPQSPGPYGRFSVTLNPA